MKEWLRWRAQNVKLEQLLRQRATMPDTIDNFTSPQVIRRA